LFGFFVFGSLKLYPGIRTKQLYENTSSIIFFVLIFMQDALVLIFVGAVATCVGVPLVYFGTREDLPKWFKAWTPLFGPPRYDVPDEWARVGPVAGGTILAVIGSIAFAVGTIMLMVTLVNRLG